MGCCNSRQVAAPAHHDGAEDTPVAHLDVSSRNLNAPASRQTSVPSSRDSFLGHSSQPAATSSTNAQPTSNARPNQPLMLFPVEQRSTLPTTLASSTNAKGKHRIEPLSDSSSQKWTSARLEKERRDWWDTRVTGDIQVWRCLQAATEALQEGDVATAQTLLDAQECTCPSGQLWSRIYDDRGNEYRVPEWLVIEPAGISEEDNTPMNEDKTEDTTAIEDPEPDREFVVRVRISETSTDLKVSVRTRETVASIREKLKTQTQMANDQQFLLVYNGHVYNDNETLESNGYWNFDNNYILSCFVRPRESSSM